MQALKDAFTNKSEHTCLIEEAALGTALDKQLVIICLAQEHFSNHLFTLNQIRQPPDHKSSSLTIRPSL